MASFVHQLAQELDVKATSVEAAIGLLDEGATVPFIARYRKERTGGLTDDHLRTLNERLIYLRALDDRRQTILDQIKSQGKLTDRLARDIQSATTKSELEDLYLPFRPKRRTKGQAAIEAGLEPLAKRLFKDQNLDPAAVAEAFRNPDADYGTAEEVLDGAQFILMEHLAERATILAECRRLMQRSAMVTAVLVKGKEQAGAKFADYFNYHEPLGRIPSHRALAVFRAKREGVLRLSLQAEGGQEVIARHLRFRDQGRPGDAWLGRVIEQTWRQKVRPHLETELLGDLRERADDDAIRVFAVNLKDLLLAAPAGARRVMGLDPGLRTGVKWVVVDETGKLLDHGVIFPHVPKREWSQSKQRLERLIEQHRVSLVSIGNGTGSRETDQLVAELEREHPQLGFQRAMVSEAGASVYSASALAAEEFPDLDVSYRGAVSIARRIQDPLAELVKIDPKSIGVGQYQHDVNQTKLANRLAEVVEDCVNAVGVDANTASAALLTHVSGLNKTLAQNLVTYRDQHGAFTHRRQLLDIPRFGARTFELAAGFLRIQGGNQPLDASAVHPESYPLVDHIADSCGLSLQQLIGNTSVLQSIKAQDFVGPNWGLPTIQDVLSELDKPGRDPRPEFKTAEFKAGVETIDDLENGMRLEGVVTNVTHFGAFVDVGVHQDGLVHISQMANHFVRDPHEVVKAGDVVQVRVESVDLARRRIALSMKTVG